MLTTEARVTSEQLDAIQEARGRVPILEFRLRSDCAMCLFLMEQPATFGWNARIRSHILDEHRDEVSIAVNRLPLVY